VNTIPLCYEINQLILCREKSLFFSLDLYRTHEVHCVGTVYDFVKLILMVYQVTTGL